MSFSLPDDLDVLTNIHSGIKNRIQTLQNQQKYLILKNQRGKPEEKIILDILIKDLKEEIEKIKIVGDNLLKYISDKFEIKIEEEKDS